MSGSSLYRRVLGEKLDLLPQPLRRFHDSTAGARAEGKLCVKRADGLVRSAIANAFRLPPSSDSIAVRLTVTCDGDREVWVRDFGGRELASVQWEEDGFLVEQVSSVRFVFNLVPDRRGLAYELRECRFGAIAVPHALAPRVFTTTSGSDSGWHLSMRMEVPVLGRLLEYEGNMRCLS